MCGVVAYVGTEGACPMLMATLARLQHLGRHSAGMATLTADGIQVRRALGECVNLAASVGAVPLPGVCGIAHTRGATVGSTAEINAHPHCSGDGRIAVVHSGDITNHVALRAELEAAGVTLRSETDSETIPHLIDRAYRVGATRGDAVASVRAAVARLEGPYAFAAVFADRPGRIVAVRRGSPLVIGRRRATGAQGDALLLASEIWSLRGKVDEVCFFRDGQLVELELGTARLSSLAGEPVAMVYWRWPLAVAGAALRRAWRKCRQAATWPLRWGRRPSGAASACSR